MIKPEVLDALVAAGCTAEQIAAAIKADMHADEARKEQKRENNAERQRRFRERNAVSRVTGVTNAHTPSPSEVSPHTPLPKNPNPIPPSAPKGASSPTVFSQFWEIYPHKVGKRDAEKAFVQALKRDSFENIMAGLRRYIAKTDDRPWCNPSTFLNQDRWLDAPSNAPPPRHSAAPPRRQNAFEAYDEIARLKGWNNEPGIVPSTDEDVQRLSAVGERSTGVVVDLRRGHDWRS